jgi:hypothetical protein
MESEKSFVKFAGAKVFVSMAMINTVVKIAGGPVFVIMEYRNPCALFAKAAVLVSTKR